MNKEPLQESIKKEKAARKKAERLLKDKGEELLLSNKKLQKNNRNLKFKNEALGLLVSLINFAHTKNTDITQTLKCYLEEVCKFCKWPLGHIYFVQRSLKNNNETKLTPGNIWYGRSQEKFKNFIEQTMKTEFQADDGIPGSVMKTNKPVWLDHAFDEGSFLRQQEGRKLDMIGAYAVPLFVFGEIYAIAEFFADDSSKKKKHYLEFAISAAAQVSTIIERLLSEDRVKSKNKELQNALNELKQIQLQLVQTSKMASLGQLAAGIAHEINNPISYLENNLRILGKYVNYYKGVRKKRQLFFDKIIDFLPAEIAKEKSEYDTDSEKINYLLSDIEALISESLEGVQRVTEIVLSLKSFARLDEAEYKIVNINECVESTIKVIWNELKYKCELKKELSPNIPSIKCNPGQINQVIMNILVNASQAIEGKGLITIKTLQSNSEVCILISDTGSGISEENIHAIFEPFFTTKPVGIGTGLGLSVSYGIIQKHGGKIEVHSELGLGTTFEIFLPITRINDVPSIKVNES
ncbi:MAG: hypothetical protein BGO43_05645 [Gammaproteobacteria bacterium 39-13]|nr:hypothetical protein [Gammaproteobacteria bacterium]OJV91521.1 MAG: hypothetical protein BGO43_05645 [Gammaproteobacteria bacterium 39-13]